MLGTAIGAIASAVYLSLLPFHPIGMAAAIFATGVICGALNVPSHGRLALNPGLNALLRFAESCIGTAVAVLVVVLWPQRREPR